MYFLYENPANQNTMQQLFDHHVTITFKSRYKSLLLTLKQIHNYVIYHMLNMI